MKRSKKFLALALALVMCLSLIPAAAFAKTTPPFKIVSIGDSTSNGYCLDDYGRFSDAEWYVTPNDRDAYGFMDHASKKATGSLMKQYLSGAPFNMDVELINLGIEGMRTDELRAILDPSYDGDKWCDTHMDWYNNKLFSSYQSAYPEESSLTDLFIREISEADLIIMDCCTNNFGTYIMRRISGAGYDETVLDVADSLAPGFKEMAEKAIDKYFASLKGILPEGMAKELVETVGYCLFDMCANFSVDVAKILALNPDAKLIAVGPFNIMQGFTAVLNGIEIDFANIWGTLINLANTYITTFDPNNDKFYFADVMGGVDMLIKPISEGKFTSFYLNDIIKTFVTDNTQKAQLIVANDFLAKHEPGDPGYDAYYNAIYSGDFGAVLSIVSKAAGMTRLDLSDALGLLSRGTAELQNAATTAAKTGVAQGWDALTPSDQSLMHLAIRFFINNGSGTHPSESGYEQKFEAVKKAYDKKITAASCAADTAANTGIHAAVGIINTLKAPIVNAINKLFSFIDLGHFFDMIFDGVTQFLLRFVR